MAKSAEDERSREAALAASRALPEKERTRLAGDVLTRARQLRDEVREDLSLQRWGADDLQMERYNRLASTTAWLYADNPAIGNGLIVLPDAMLQSYGTLIPVHKMPPDLPARRIEGRLTVLIERLEMALGDAAATPPAAPKRVNVQDERDERRYEWDAFICHASEDKEPFVRELANALRRYYRVWYDEFSLRIGDSLRRAIDQGLANSRYGVVVLSPSFFKKEWPQDELDGLAGREISGEKVILPIWLDIDRDGVARYSPILAGRVAARAADGVERVVEQLREAMGNAGNDQATATLPRVKTPLEQQGAPSGETDWSEDTNRPRFDVIQKAVTRLETSFQPQFGVTQVSGDRIPHFRWRFRGPRFSMEWAQASAAAVDRTHFTAMFDLSQPPVADDLVGTEELGFEILFHWRGQWHGEIHRWPISRRDTGSKVLWDVAAEIIPPLEIDCGVEEVQTAE